jgi:hypothetical protein
MEQALKKQLRVWLTGFFLCAQRNKMLQEAFFLSHRLRCRSWRFNGLVPRFKARRTLSWVGGTGGNCTCTLGLGAGAGLASLRALSLGALFCRCRKKKNAHCRVRSTNFAPVSRKHQRHTWRGARAWRLPNSCEQSCEGVFGREVETLTLFNFTTLFFGFLFCFQLRT